MSQKTKEYLAAARAWIDKNAGSDLDVKPVSQALEAAERAVRDVEALKEKLDTASNEKKVSMMVLQETLKSMKHARKAHEARAKNEKSDKDQKSEKKKAKAQPKAT